MSTVRLQRTITKRPGRIVTWLGIDQPSLVCIKNATWRFSNLEFCIVTFHHSVSKSQRKQRGDSSGTHHCGLGFRQRNKQDPETMRQWPDCRRGFYSCLILKNQHFCLNTASLDPFAPLMSSLLAGVKKFSRGRNQIKTNQGFPTVGLIQIYTNETSHNLQPTIWDGPKSGFF